MRALLSLGANLGDRRATLERATELLDRLPQTKVVRRSSFCETAAVGVPEPQPDYINCVVELETEFSPKVLMGMCLGIETALGRERPGEKSPRVVDIDVLMCGSGDESIIMEERELTLPHPRMMERRFVLEPLAELYPEKRVFGLDFSENFEKTADQVVKKL